jgi:predicted nucleotidyltransferase
MILDRLYKQHVINPPKWLTSNTHYLTIMGSEAYGASGASSDVDFYGFAIPPRHHIFPHEAGAILDFGSQTERFQQWQEHHVKDPSKDVEYDFQVFGIVKYFNLCMANNPNVIDSLYTARRCVVHITQVGEHVKINRKTFLHKGSFHKMTGYAYSQLGKMKSKSNASNPKRAADIETHGYDTKFGMHLIRLIMQAEQILVEHDLDLERNREVLKSIRRGEWTLERIEDFFTSKEKSLQQVYIDSKLRQYPDEDAIKQILLECLEMHFGSLEKAVIIQPNIEKMATELRAVLDKYVK